MNNLLKLEEFAMMCLGAFLLWQLPVSYPFWLWIILFLSPDIGMLGYLAGPGTGAVVYNIFHHKGIALALYAIGLYLPDTSIQLAGLLLFTHASFDRVFGYGLKLKDGFGHTHLGIIN